MGFTCRAHKRCDPTPRGVRTEVSRGSRGQELGTFLGQRRSAKIPRVTLSRCRWSGHSCSDGVNSGLSGVSSELSALSGSVSVPKSAHRSASGQLSATTVKLCAAVCGPFSTSAGWVARYSGRWPLIGTLGPVHSPDGQRKAHRPHWRPRRGTRPAAHHAMTGQPPLRRAARHSGQGWQRSLCPRKSLCYCLTDAIVRVSTGRYTPQVRSLVRCEGPTGNQRHKL